MTTTPCLTVVCTQRSTSPTSCVFLGRSQQLGQSKETNKLGVSQLSCFWSSLVFLIACIYHSKAWLTPSHMANAVAQLMLTCNQDPNVQANIVRPIPQLAYNILVYISRQQWREQSKYKLLLHCCQLQLACQTVLSTQHSTLPTSLGALVQVTTSSIIQKRLMNYDSPSLTASSPNQYFCQLVFTIQRLGCLHCMSLMTVHS